MANYKEEMAKIIISGCGDVITWDVATFTAAEILHYLSSMELPELPLISPDEIADARLHPDLSDLPSVMLPICECISLQETAAYTTVAKKQRNSDLPILAAQRAEIEELKKNYQREHDQYAQLVGDYQQLTEMFSTARAETDDYKRRLDDVVERHTIYTQPAPDKEGGK